MDLKANCESSPEESSYDVHSYESTTSPPDDQSSSVGSVEELITVTGYCRCNCASDHSQKSKSRKNKGRITTKSNKRRCKRNRLNTKVSITKTSSKKRRSNVVDKFRSEVRKVRYRSQSRSTDDIEDNENLYFDDDSSEGEAMQPAKQLFGWHFWRWPQTR